MHTGRDAKRASIIVTILDAVTSVSVALAAIAVVLTAASPDIPLMLGAYVAAGLASIALGAGIIAAIIQTLDRIRRAVESQRDNIENRATDGTKTDRSAA